MQTSLNERPGRDCGKAGSETPRAESIMLPKKNAITPTKMPRNTRSRGMGVNQSSHIVSRSRSCRRSAPQTLHLFLESLLPKPRLRPRPSGTSRLDLRPSPPSSRSAAALSFRIRSASMASSSASGLSSIVSSEEMEGLRERIEVGVDGTEDDASEDG